MRLVLSREEFDSEELLLQRVVEIQTYFLNSGRMCLSFDLPEDNSILIDITPNEKDINYAGT